MPPPCGASPEGERSKAAGGSPTAPIAESGSFSRLGVERELLSGDLRAFAGLVKGIALPSLTA